MVQGEWASPCAARRCEQRSRETKSVMSKEGGVLLAGEGGERTCNYRPKLGCNWKQYFLLP